MEIKTKYSLGDKVWLMWYNRAIQREISRIYVFINNQEKCETYGLMLEDDEDDVHISEIEHEPEDLFPTKQELLNSL